MSGEIADGAGELGFYSPHSWWPLPVGFFAAITFLGIIFGWWLVIIGADVRCAGRDRTGVRVLPGRARSLSRRSGRPSGGLRPAPWQASGRPPGMPIRYLSDWRGIGRLPGQPVRLVGRLPRQERSTRDEEGVSGGSGRPVAGHGAGRLGRVALPAVALVAALALLSGCTSTPSASGPAAQAAVDAGDAPKVSAATIDVTPASASVDVPVDQPVT